MGRDKTGIFFLALFTFSVMFVSSCSKSDETTQQEIKRLQVRNEVQNLMGRYVFYHMSGLNFMAAQNLFTTYDDTVIEMMWGRYTGKDAAYRAYAVAHRPDDLPTITALALDAPRVDASFLDKDRGVMPPVIDSDAGEPVSPAGAAAQAVNEGAISRSAASQDASAQGAPPASGVASSGPGITQARVDASTGAGIYFHLTALTSPVIEVAGDCETARAVWICPGLDGMQPVWMKYGCDFKKQDGAWKIWHLHVYGLTRGLEAADSFTLRTEPANGADKAPTTNWEYSRQAAYVPYEPEPPQPYDTWDYAKMQPKSYGDPN